MNVEIQLDASKRDEIGLAKVSIHVHELELKYALDLPFRKLYERCGIPDPVVLDLLITASVCYVIDKIVSRVNASDNWTREFEVAFPVFSPELWESVVRELETALGFLTGDVWQISFRKHDVAPFRLPLARLRRRRRRKLIPNVGIATTVCLFSGGLDSLIGAIDLLAGKEKEKVFLVGHYDVAGPASQQKNLFAEIQGRYPWQAELLQTRVSHRPDEALELTLRSRSLVFMALGVYVARSFGRNVPLYAPENGLIAINIPLTPSRSGSCSTRTMHPFFLERLEAVLRRLGVDNRIINPLSLKTKGESVTECLNQALLQAVAESSVSCSHATRKQHWVRKGANNCGYCVPCMIRRAALHKVGWDEGQDYGIDICEEELPIDDEGESADDLRAMLDFIRQDKTADEISREIRGIAPVSRLEDYTAVVERGFEEIRALIRDKAKFSISQAAGIAMSTATSR